MQRNALLATRQGPKGARQMQQRSDYLRRMQEKYRTAPMEAQTVISIWGFPDGAKGID